MTDLINKCFMEAVKAPTEENFEKLQNALNTQEVAEAQKQMKNDKHAETSSKYSEEAVNWTRKLQEAVAVGSTYSALVPKEIATQVEMKMATYGKLRQYCTVHNMGGSYTFVCEDSGATAAWKAEAGAVDETTPSATPITLTAQALTALVKVSRELAADVDVMMDYIVNALAKGFAKAEDKAILEGAGFVSGTSYQPVGIITKLKAQNNTPQVVTGAAGTTTTIGFTWANLKAVISKVGEHRNGAVIICNQNTLDHIYEMKNNNTYIFDQTRPLDSIWGMPVIVSDLMDDGYTQASNGTDNYPVVVANLSYYHLGERQGLELTTLSELYAANRQIGILADKRLDGNFANYSAFAALKIAHA